MTTTELKILEAKLISAISFGIQSNGNLAWAKAQLSAVQSKLTVAGR